jgi:ubiquitin-conjugating enzyme (huntingtin interacting protein 2)
MAAANGRLTKELAEVGKDDKISGVKAVPLSEGNLRVLKGTILGPEGTCYEGGVFDIDIQIPKQYPFEPPKMKFTTKIWHPNISSQTGAICLVRFLFFVTFFLFQWNESRNKSGYLTLLFLLLPNRTL